MTKKTGKSYDELKQELDGLMHELQREDLGVDEALKRYERGLVLVREIEAYLKKAENKVLELRAEFKAEP